MTSVQPHGLPRDLAACLAEQQHGRYTNEEHEAWREVLGRTTWLASHWRRYLPGEYAEGLRALALPMAIPTLEHINEKLEGTGWTTVCVEGYIPSAAYVGFLARGIFPIARYIRRRESADYSPTPDMAHDIVGHLPMLFSEEYREFLRALARVMVKARPSSLDEELYEANRDMAALKSTAGPAKHAVEAAERRVARVRAELAVRPSDLTQLSRMYLWSVEFGLLLTEGGFTVHGAALLSSVTEMGLVCYGHAALEPYTIDVIKHDIEFSDLQRRYFIAESYDHMHAVLAEFEQMME